MKLGWRFGAIAMTALAAAGMVTDSAMAGTATANMSVTASVGSFCTISANPLAFGTYVTGANSDQTTTVTVNCTTGLSPTVGVNTNGSGQRNLTNGANLLTYTLYTDVPGGTPWTSTTFVPAVADGTNHSLTVAGRIASGQTPATGPYSDTVVVTVNF
jgi:spore coat protein U-like protein